MIVTGNVFSDDNKEIKGEVGSNRVHIYKNYNWNETEKQYAFIDFERPMIDK